MTGPQPDELVFSMSNNMKTDVKYVSKPKHGKIIRGLGKFSPIKSLKSKANQRVMVQTTEEKMTGFEGTCAALSAMYLLKTYEIGVSLSRSDIEHQFKLRIAQAAFEKWSSGDYSQQRERLLDLMTLKTVNKGVRIPLQDTISHIETHDGRYMVALRYDNGGGHMVAMRKAGSIYYYFEPEEGLYRFPSASRFLDALSGALLSSGSLTTSSESSWWQVQKQ